MLSNVCRGWGGRGAMLYLDMVRNFHVDDLELQHFQVPLVPYFMLNLNLIDPLFLQKKMGLSMKFIPKIGQTFHKNLIQLTTFFIVFRYFKTRFDKTLDMIGSIFSLQPPTLDPPTEHLVNCHDPSPPPRVYDTVYVKYCT